MLLTGLNNARSGMLVAASVLHPEAPETELLKPGAELTPVIIGRLRALNVQQLWVTHDLTRDLDQAVGPRLTKSRLRVYCGLKDSLERISKRSVSSAQLAAYKTVVTGLANELMLNKAAAGMADQLFATNGNLFAHSANVAYLAMVAGLGLERQISQERASRTASRGNDTVILGLAGMLHDIGKLRLTSDAASQHEVSSSAPQLDDDEYATHTVVGHQILQGDRVPPTLRNAVLHHHQRFDGGGWPDMAQATEGRICGSLAGRKIHVFARIVSAANVLDNLLRDAEGGQRPPVAALCDFAGRAFESWFDPMVRLAILRSIPPFAIGTQVELNDGRHAVVIAPNVDQPCRPTLRLLRDEVEAPSAIETVTLELSMNPHLNITHYAGIDVSQWIFELPAEGESLRRSA